MDESQDIMLGTGTPDRGSSTLLVLLSILLAAMVVVVSCFGLFTPNFYARETQNWQAQSIGQDIVDLFLIVPVLLITTFLTRRGNRPALLIWGGTVLYLVYTFAIYCFDVRFNSLFVLYCFTLGTAFYGFVYFVYRYLIQSNPFVLRGGTVMKTTAIYFLIIAPLFYLLWLSEIIPSQLAGEVPKSLIETGLPTNPVHVIDLALFLPGLIIIGVLLLRGKSRIYPMAPVLLTFFIHMDITIGGLIVVMREHGLEAPIGVTIAMTVLAVFSAVLLWLSAFGNRQSTRTITSSTLTDS